MSQFSKICITVYEDYKNNCALFLPTLLFLILGYPIVSFKFFPWWPCCHGSEFLDKIDFNSPPPVKDNCSLFLLNLYFRAQAIRWGHVNFSPGNLCCHGNEFWNRTEYNSVAVKDNCMLFLPISLYSGPRYPMVSFKFFPWRPLLPCQPTVFN